MATGMQQLRENLNRTTCAALHPLPAGTTSRVQGAMEIDTAFANMNAANCVQSASTGHNWFGNRAGAQQQFDALRKAALDSDFKGNDQFSLQAVEQLRGLLRNQNFDPKQAKALVTNMVNNAVLHAAPAGPAVTNPGDDPIGRLIEKTAPEAAPRTGTTRPAPAAPPTR